MRTLVLYAAVCAALVATAQPAKAARPHRIIGNVYFVGQDDLACFLIVTPKGNILINTGFEYTVPAIRENIKLLGFKYADTKILLNTHAHSDHAGGLAVVRKQTGAQMWALEQEAELLSTGGKTDYLFGWAGWFAPVKVDHIFKDLEPISLGGTTLIPHWTPGHTKGSTSYSLEVNENGKLYHVLVANLPNMNEGVNLLNNDRYTNIVEDYIKGIEVLKALPCDIFLSSHTTAYRLEAKYRKGLPYDPERFVDPEGYRRAVARAEERFYRELQQEKDEEKFAREYRNFKLPEQDRQQ